MANTVNTPVQRIATGLVDWALNRRSGRASGYGDYGNQGGMINTTSGAGMRGKDKGASNEWLANSQKFFYSYLLAESVYTQSWAAKKFIDIPIDDMFIAWREFLGDDADTMSGQEAEFGIKKNLAKAMKAGRLHGTGFMVMVTAEDRLAEPLNVARIRPGDLKNIIVIDRHDVVVKKRYTDPMDKKFGKPELYHITVRGVSWDCHESRMLRFDGQEPLSVRGWSSGYSWDWGISELAPVLKSIEQDESIASALSHLVHEMSIPILKLDRFSEMVAQMNDANVTDSSRANVQEMAEVMNEMKSIYHVMVMGKDDSMERLSVTFAGVKDLMEHTAMRLAAAAGIPQTRFFGRSPQGMNATGDNDALDYSVLVGSMQVSKMTDPLVTLDQVLARTGGLMTPAPYRWQPLIHISDKDRAEVLEKITNAIANNVANNVIDEREGRRVLAIYMPQEAEFNADAPYEPALSIDPSEVVTQPAA